MSGLEGVFYERKPYRSPNISDDAPLSAATRFVGLARVGNPKKEKWIYALNLQPIDKMNISKLIQRTTDETECPYDVLTLDKEGKCQLLRNINCKKYNNGAPISTHFSLTFTQ